MANFLKKALGLFVEFEPGESSHANNANDAHLAQKFPLGNIKNQPAAGARAAAPATMSQADLDKFEKHFTDLLEKANLPGPDYFEFWKMMETLEAHVPDEKTRMAAVFATLSIQGLTKPKLLETAAQYKQIVAQDRAEFDKAANDKAVQEVQGRQIQLVNLEKTVAQHAETIKKLTEEITAAQAQMKEVEAAITEHEQKIASGRQSYQLASDAMINKIETDLQKIQTSL
ncbi:hypothetical protein F0L74_06275 [Chitinophaga agrisoli]|uniref:Uncharacterized protein n=1 Tax=Chitinophaga agrisoli TaxID=2607653 RepID=A0A5B2W3X2_9BACT|nr:hypothetical protein [Chitinophaga agrisoli]KAA2245558.1 hypothetical protein F0L74_06275 [Chitinophaga agrisoli]